jgi:hypothetical protein
MSTETAPAEVAEVVEDAVDEVVELVEVVRNNPVALAVVGVLGLAAGAAGGYFVARKLLRNHYEEIAEAEIATAKDWYASLNKVTVDGDPLTPQQVLEQTLEGQEALDAIREYRGTPVETPAATEEELLEDEKQEDEIIARRVTEARVQSVSLEKEADPSKGVYPIEQVENSGSVNVFVDRNFDYEEEKKLRTKDKPYVITHDEYFGAEFEDYDTIQLTYFTDDVLVDENDKPVDDVNGTIGDESLARFGHGSKDKNIVYVRNEKLECEYEVTLADQTYLEALGLGPEPGEIKHNDQRDRRRAFRQGDG